MYDDFLRLASRLRSERAPFVVATVVRCEAPTSGKPGDRAIVTSDGNLHGWIGGGCAQPVVIAEAKKCLHDGKSRLVRVSPTAGAEPADGITGYTMMCHSGGTLDIFMEPVLPEPQLVIYGRSPVALALAKLARLLSYTVSTNGAEPAGASNDSAAATAIVVATQGEDDEGALERALQQQAFYVAFVASRKKWEAVSAYLRDKGVDQHRLDAVKAPAGIDIGAASPEEIAVSILAQMIEARRKSPSTAVPKTAVSEPVTAIDPVCGMSVDVARAKYQSAHESRNFYFCCAPCKTNFDKNPSQFLTSA